MPKDREQESNDDSREDSTGTRDPIRGHTTNSTATEEGSSGEPTAIEFELVTDALTAKQSEHRVHEVITPSQDTRNHGSFTIPTATTTAYASTTADVTVTTVVTPNNQTPTVETAGRIPTAEHDYATQVDHSVTTVVPERAGTSLDAVRVVTAHDRHAEQTTDKVTNQMRPTEQTSGGEVQLDEDDPMFSWRGGTPYASAHPQLIVHRSKEETPTLPFLHALLRDTYTELRGGEPGADAVEFVANEPRIPQIQENIVTLDLTDGAWEPALQDNQPRIERTNLDITPHLRTAASQLYTGELGYFVVNVPDRWEDEMLRPRFLERLTVHLADTELTDTADETSDPWSNRLREAPVLLAEPRVDDTYTFRQLVRGYYSLNADLETEQNDRSKSESELPNGVVPQIEAIQERALRQNDANRILLTKRQSNEGEGDDHYLWKAAIVDGLARELHECSPQSDLGFGEFVETVLLSKGIINTEADEDNVQPDISVDSKEHSGWVSTALDVFLPDSLGELDSAVIEFETGRSEGAFNFRKLRRSIEKYSKNEERPVCLAIPTRLLFRGEKRARMILRIVTATQENDELPSVEVAVPTLTQGRCRRLQPARSVVEAIYTGGDNDT